MSTTVIGREAEQAAADFLQRQGYEIMGRNWRTRWCEIDLVARKVDCVHCVEVTYRSQDLQGSVLEYITKAKLKQMGYAADHWLAEHSWDGGINLAAIELSTPDYVIVAFIDSVY